MQEIENKIIEIENKIKNLKANNKINVFMVISEYIMAFVIPAIVASPEISVIAMYTFIAIPNFHYDIIYKNIVEREKYEKEIKKYKEIIKNKIEEEKKKENNESTMNNNSKEHQSFSKFMNQKSKYDFDINKMIDEIVEKMASEDTIKRSAEDIINDESKSIDEKIIEIITAIKIGEISKEEAIRAINNKAASAKTKEEMIMWHPDKFQAIIKNVEIKEVQKIYKK